MGLKIETGSGKQRKLGAGCGMKSSSRESREDESDRDTQFAGCFEIDGGIEDGMDKAYVRPSLNVSHY